MVSKDQFVSWKRSEVGRLFDQEIAEASEVLVAEVMNRIESNPNRDLFVKGMLSAFSAMMAWKPEPFIEMENPDEQV